MDEMTTKANAIVDDGFVAMYRGAFETFVEGSEVEEMRGMFDSFVKAIYCRGYSDGETRMMAVVNGEAV